MIPADLSGAHELNFEWTAQEDEPIFEWQFALLDAGKKNYIVTAAPCRTYTLTISVKKVLV